ncbi:hypothetical protein SCOR_35040 [Sulfidibacter corallicola]
MKGDRDPTDFDNLRTLEFDPGKPPRTQTCPIWDAPSKTRRAFDLRDLRGLCGKKIPRFQNRTRISRHSPSSGSELWNNANPAPIVRLIQNQDKHYQDFVHGVKTLMF